MLIVSGDHIYSMDYRQLIREHLEHGADMTIALQAHPGAGPALRLRRAGRRRTGARLRGEAGRSRPSDLVSLTIYVFNAGAARGGARPRFKDHDSIEFGRDVIPAMMARYRVFGHVFDGYWAYTRTVDAYYEAHQDLLDGRSTSTRWRVRTNNKDNGLVRQVPPHLPHLDRGRGLADQRGLHRRRDGARQRARPRA